MLVERTKEKLTKQTTKFRKPISLEEKIAITLRFLATGESYSSLMYQFRISCSTISIFVPEVCEVIYQEFADEFMKCPQSEEDWQNICRSYEEKWQFPNCFRAADGKHIALFHPKVSGSTYYNYKGFYNILLMALVDANYRFLFADVGCQGRTVTQNFTQL